MKRTRVGIVGCGNISGIYFKTCLAFERLELVAAADLDPSRAEAALKNCQDKLAAGEWKGKLDREPVALSVEKLIAHPDIDMVLNLTVPKAHCGIAIQALQAGKHTYSEKPMGINRDEAKKVMALAAQKKLRVGCAPDTFFGGGHQTCRKIVDDGWIGQPLAAVAFMACRGHETWHPSPEFYYEAGGGPMFDMGPYYLTALVNMLGPVERVAGMTKASFPTRTITSQPKFGKVVKVETPTHITGTAEFASGLIATLIMSFDIPAHHLPCIEIYGAAGTLQVPDPNGFGGTPMIKRLGGKDWTPMALTHGYAENSRGVGLMDMAAGLLNNRPHRASGELAYHVTDVMAAFLDAGATGKTIEIASTCQRPAILPMGLRDGDVD